MTNPDAFHIANNGFLRGIKSWADLDTLWSVLRNHNDGDWYIYTVENNPPTQPVSTNELSDFITQLDQQLHEQHEEDYCGIVYCDNPANPSFIKVYDPKNLGVVCGYSDNPPLPGWIITRHLPSSLKPVEKPSMWKKILHTFN